MGRFKVSQMDSYTIDVSKMQPVDLIEGDSLVETDLLKKMEAEAHEFICR